MKIQKRQRIILIAGGVAIAMLWGFAFVLRSTTWLDKPSITCRNFLTKDPAYPKGQAKVCINEVLTPFNPLSHDGDYQISFYNPATNRRIDISMRVNIPSTTKKLSLLWHVQKIQVYDANGVQVSESKERHTDAYSRYLPADINEPLWWWLVHMSRLYPEAIHDLETDVDILIENCTKIVASIGTTAITAWKFFQAAGDSKL